MFKKYTIIALGALMLGGQAVQCEEGPEHWRPCNVKKDWMPRSKVSVGTKLPWKMSSAMVFLFCRVGATQETQDAGYIKICRPVITRKGGGLDFETIIYGSREELSHPSANVDATGNVSRAGILFPRHDFHDSLLNLRTRILLKVEEKIKLGDSIKEAPEECGRYQGEPGYGLYSSDDVGTKCLPPVFDGKNESSGWMRCVTSYRPFRRETGGMIRDPKPLTKPL